MRSIDEYDGWSTLRAALLILALTMVRPGEVRHMRKSELTIPKALWRIPAERMKNASTIGCATIEASTRRYW